MLELFLYGIIGDAYDKCDAATIVPLINAADGDITLRINSPGGLVFDGLAILNALQQHSGKVIVKIDGFAGSMASVIAMTGDEIIMAESGLLMIHNPTDGQYGDAEELRKTADRLDKVKAQIVAVYISKTGLSEADITTMMDAETYLDASEALAAGFVTAIAPAMKMAACDVSAFGFRKAPVHPLLAPAKRPPAPVALVIPKEPKMEPVVQPVVVAPPVIVPPAIVAPVISQPVNIDTAVAAALAMERARTSTIRAEVQRAHLAAEFADTLVNEGVSLEVARERIIDQIATAAPQITNYQPALIPAAQFAARGEAMGNAILNLANPRLTPLDDASRAFAGRSLRVLAREWLDSTGISTRNMSDVQVAQAAMRPSGMRNAGQHTIADFPSVLGNTVGRTLRRAYDLAPKTYQAFCRQASIPDFRPVSRAALSDISQMKQIKEGGEYTYATIGDAAEQYSVGKWGQIISLSWETIINDDLSAFDRLPMAMGQEAAQIEGDIVYGILLANAAMSDAVALFHATHKNLAGVAAAINVASLSAGRTAMRQQTAPKGRPLAVAPAQLIVGPLKELEAAQFTSANYVATKNADINPDYNRTLTVTIDPRITDLRWFLAADPNSAAIDTIEYSYLSGAEGVMIEQRQGFEVDGLDIKARLVFGAKAIDWRGMYMNTGA